MQTSEMINELAASLAKAQALVKGAMKDATNPHFRSSYADLSSVWDACRDALTTNGLSVVQAPASGDDG
ncbi:MAG: ERF family protein, partial [bacterium]|nr:ERF family protein [bacterium]